MKRIIVLALAALIVVPAAEADTETTIQRVPVFKADGGPPNFNVGRRVRGASATVYRNDDGIGVIISTKKLSRGAFTAWLFECSGTHTDPCAPFLPPSFCSADTVGRNGKMHLACGITATGTPGNGFSNSRNPFVVLILDHGRIDPDLIHRQLSNPMSPPPATPVQTVKVKAVYY